MFEFILKQLKSKKGFTLVELVVVIAILGILAAIAVPKLGKSRLTSQVAAHNANVRILKSAAAMYLADNPNEEDGVITDKVKDYLDNEKLPTPYKYAEDAPSTFTVTITNGNIEISPGELNVNGDKAELVLPQAEE